MPTDKTNNLIGRLRSYSAALGHLQSLGIHPKTPGITTGRVMLDTSEAADEIQSLLQDEVDAARYRRLRVLGCAPIDTKELDAGLVMRFQNLDDHLDADIKAHASRGEFKVRHNG
jgi:hypothetical protein